MAGPANLHQIRYLVSGLLREMEERMEMRVQGVAEEVAEMRKESMRSRIEGRVVGHGMWCGSDQAGGRPLGGGGPLNSHLVPSGTSGEDKEEEQESEEQELEHVVGEEAVVREDRGAVVVQREWRRVSAERRVRGMLSLIHI